MPVLSRFYGIIIRMYFQQSEHNPPHIHAIYGEHVAAIDFQKKKVIEGELPSNGVFIFFPFSNNSLHEISIVSFHITP